MELDALTAPLLTFRHLEDDSEQTERVPACRAHTFQVPEERPPACPFHGRERLGAGTPAGELRPVQWEQWEWREEARREGLKGADPDGVVMEKERRKTPRSGPWAPGEGEQTPRRTAQGLGEDPGDVWVGESHRATAGMWGVRNRGPGRTLGCRPCRLGGGQPLSRDRTQARWGEG